MIMVLAAEAPYPALTLAPALALALAGLFLLSFLLPERGNQRQLRQLWQKIDVVGLPSGLFPWPRALVASLTNMVQTTQDGYEKFSKTRGGRPFALPTMWTGDAVVVLPPSRLDLLNKPDNELSSAWAIFDNIQLTYHIDREVLTRLIHFEVSRRDLTQRHVDRQIQPTAQEIELCFREIWGVETKEWTTVAGWDTLGRIMTRVALRTIVGSPMCSNEELLEQSRLFANSIFSAAVFINGMPPFMRPVMGRLLSLQARYHKRRCQGVLMPLVKERLRLWEASQKSSDVELPNDFLQWLITRCAGHGPENLVPSKLTMRLLTLNTMFVFGMSYVFAHTVIDLCARPNRDEFLSGIDEECRRVSAEYAHEHAGEGFRCKEAVDRFYRADSAIRESMRISDVSVVGLPRDVVGDKPLDLGEGIFAPPGTRTVFPTQSVHLDPEYWEDPLRFDAFRFSRPFEPEPGRSSGEKKKDEGEGEGERKLLTTLTPDFLAFGYGKRACTGRWFVAQTIKQTLAYLVMMYDVEIVGDPPKRQALMNMMVPPVDIKLRVRRKSK